MEDDPFFFFFFGNNFRSEKNRFSKVGVDV